MHSAASRSEYLAYIHLQSFFEEVDFMIFNLTLRVFFFALYTNVKL